MTVEVWAAIIGGVAGLLTGAISSLVAPWAKWSIEQRRLKRQRQYALLDWWRAGIAAIQTDDHTEILRSQWYEALRPYLSEASRKQIERPRTDIVPAEHGRGLKGLFTGEVDRIEREWGLRP